MGIENIILIIIIPVVIGAFVANSKNRSVIKAIGLTFFLSWLGLIIVLCLQSKKFCPDCRNKMPKEALLCTMCGYDVRIARKEKIKRFTDS